MKKRRVLLGMMVGTFGAVMRSLGQDVVVGTEPSTTRPTGGTGLVQFGQLSEIDPDPLMLEVFGNLRFGVSMKSSEFIVRGDGREVRIGVKELMDILEGRDA